VPDKGLLNGCVCVIIKWDTHNHLMAFCPPLPGGGLLPEEKCTHPHPAWSPDILYQLRPSSMIHVILFVQFACLTVLFHNVCPGHFWSSTWSGTLYFILHTSNHHLFATHSHTIAACFAVVPMLCHLFLISLSLSLSSLPWESVFYLNAMRHIRRFSSLLAEVPPHLLTIIK